MTIDQAAMRIADRLDVLREVDQIAADLILVEHHCGPRADGDELRHRLATTRRLVLAQLFGLLDVLNESQPTVH